MIVFDKTSGKGYRSSKPTVVLHGGCFHLNNAATELLGESTQYVQFAFDQGRRVLEIRPVSGFDPGAMKVTAKASHNSAIYVKSVLNHFNIGIESGQKLTLHKNNNKNIYIKV